METPPDQKASFGLLCRFVDPSESFVLGFEAGRLSHRMEQGESPIQDPVPIHAKNAEQVRLLAEAFGYDAQIYVLQPPSQEWANLVLTKRPAAKPERHLRSV